MSEPRRVAFNTISSNVSQAGTLTAAAGGSGAAYRTIDADNALMANKTATFFGGNEDGTENSTKPYKTFRLELTLFQTDSSKYPEFDYSRLIHLEKKKLKKLKTRTNGFSDDPFDNGSEADVERIARELEEKYGAAYGSGRSRRNLTHDKAIGYDEDDSFIDNAEAFDENVPDEVETLEGGFYINCGALEFKKLHTEQVLKTKTDEIIKMPNRPKKRELSTSSSEDTTTTDEEDDVDDDEEAEEEEADDSSTTNNRQKSGNSSSSTTASVNTKNKNVNDKKIMLSSSSNSPKAMGEEMGSDSDKDGVPVKTTTIKDMIKAKRDNYLKNQLNEEKSNAANGLEKRATNKSTDDEDADSTTTTGESEDTEDSLQSAVVTENDKKLPNVVAIPTTSNEENAKKQEVKLPAGLSGNLLELLRNFKETAMSKGMIGKKFQFDDRTTEQFLKIDNLLLTLDKATRNLVLAHLEYHLQLRKYYFLRKEKQFRIKEEKQKNKRALAKLKKCIIETMPSAIAEYEVQLRKYADLHTAAANINADQPPIMPKKVFPWNMNLSNLVYEVYEVRLNSYTVLRTRKESLEEFINEYLRSKVLALWPNGWVRVDDLLREIEKAKMARNKINKVNPEPISQNAVSTSEIATTSTPALTMNVPTTNKRKNADGTTKPRKNKSQKKSHNEIAGNNKKVSMAKATTEFPMNLQQQHQQLQQNQKIVNLQSTAAAFSAFQQQHQQQQQIPTHSIPTTKTAHVIDLDNYKNAEDILQTSKQIINAAAQQQQQQQQEHMHVQESGSESDGVEIVGVYQNRPVNAKNVHKQKSNKNLETLLQNFPPPTTTKLYGTNAAVNINNNNNNNNNNYNRKSNIKLNMETLLQDAKNFEQMQTATTTNINKNQ